MSQSMRMPWWMVAIVAGLAGMVLIQGLILWRMQDRLGTLARHVGEASAIAAEEELNHPEESSGARHVPSSGQDMSRDDDPWASQWDTQWDAWGNDSFDPLSWDPFEEMQRMQDHINSLFGSAFGRFSRSPRFGGLMSGLAFALNVDVEDQGDHYLVTVDMPGADASNVQVDVRNNVLTIQGRREEASESSTAAGAMVRRERRLGQFQRSVTLPEPVEADQMTTTYEDGVLVISLPKKGYV